MSTVLPYLLSGISVGGQYALIAIGYTMVYGILRLINFAHGDVFMVAGILMVYISASGLPLYLSIPLVLILTALIGFVIERVAYKPLRNASRLSPLISAIGMSTFLQNYVLLAQTSDFVAFPDLLPDMEFLSYFGDVMGPSDFLILVVSFITMLALMFWIRYTRMGKAMRATAQNRKMAMLLGINTDHLISVTFIVGSALAAIGGVLIASHMGQINFFIGFLAGMKAFTAAVLGGIGSVPGAVLGGLVLGLAESFTTGYIAGNYEDVLSFCLLILILIFRPDGLLGKKQVQKV